MVICRGEVGARMFDGDGHLSPHHFESGDEWVVLVGLLLKPLLASEVLAKPISVRMRLHVLRSRVLGSGDGASCTPLA